MSGVNHKFSNISLLLLLSFLFYNCIGEDVIDDFIEAELRITNPIQQLQISGDYTYEATYFNNIGLAESATVTWESSNPTIVSIDANGTATGHAPGNAMITAQTTSGNTTITSTTSLTIIDEGDQDSSDNSGNGDDVTTSSQTKSGTIISTSSYLLEGDFTVLDTGTNIRIDIDNNYMATTSLPGLYVYLSNNPNSTNGALEIGAVDVFSGSHSYTVNNIGLNDYKYLLYFCKPFNVKVGNGELE